ncbi:LysM peptidoglycan-binding domain-containing protein [Treponema pallidum]|nr:LysM peptidoglycan-binding domain-containing protein [Treponema pallidum]
MMRKLSTGLLLWIAFISGVTSCKSAPPAEELVEVAPPVEEQEEEPMTPVPEEPMAVAPQEVSRAEYVVKNEDTLSQIAKKFYGSRIRGYYFPIIMACSEGVVTHPDRIRPGMKLVIPNFDEFMADPDHVRRGLEAFAQVERIYRSEGKMKLAEFMNKLGEKIGKTDPRDMPR